MSIPAPTSAAEVIAQLTEESDGLYVTVNTAEAHIEAWFPGQRFKFGVAHFLLTQAAVLLEEATGQPYGKYHGAGTNKSGGGGGGG